MESSILAMSVFLCSRKLHELLSGFVCVDIALDRALSFLQDHCLKDEVRHF